MIVQKYGGTSVNTAVGVRRVCRRIAETVRSGCQVVAVVAATGRTTDRLIDLAYRIASDPPPRELDILMANGETIAAPLVAMGLHGMGVPAVSLSGLQAGVRTDSRHANAHITDVQPFRVLKALEEGRVAVVAGFQGATEDLEVTTLGRGGADTTAVALASALNAETCEIYGAAEGILTADSRVVPEARLLRRISYEESLELAATGLSVVLPRAVEIGELHGVPIHVRSTYHRRPGTLIVSEARMDNGRDVRAVAYEAAVGKVRVHGVPNDPGVTAAIFEPLGQQGISVDIIAQVGSNDLLTFMVRDSELRKVVEVIEPVAHALGGVVTHAGGLAKVSIVGNGMRGTPGSAARLFRTLADAGINIETITTSEIRITCIVDRAKGERAVRALHTAFDLDKARGAAEKPGRISGAHAARWAPAK